MKMSLEFLLLVAATFPSCLSWRGHDSSEDSRQDSPKDFSRDSPRGSLQDSGQDSRRDSQDFPRDFPQDSPKDSGQDFQDSPRDSPRFSPRNSRGRSRGRSPPSPRLLPAPLVLLLLPSEPGPPRIRCLAPRRFPGSTFELLPVIPGGKPGETPGEIPVRSVPAAPDQHWAEFSLPGPARCWRCRYRNHNGSAWLESEPSPGIGSSGLGDAECQLGDPGVTGAPPTAGTLRNDPPWILPVSLGVAVPGLLLLLMAVAWAVLRRRRGRSPTASSFPMAPAPTSLSR